MTNAKVYQGFRDDKKVEEHCCRSSITNIGFLGFTDCYLYLSLTMLFFYWYF